MSRAIQVILYSDLQMLFRVILFLSDDFLFVVLIVKSIMWLCVYLHECVLSIENFNLKVMILSYKWDVYGN